MLRAIDIIDKENQFTGTTSDPDDANNRGLWHRGIHVFVYTTEGRILIQKRSRDVFQHPGKIDIGVGGYVDQGETPEQAAIREVKEETGLTLIPDQLQLLGLTRHNRRWKFNGEQKINRAIIYNYGALLPTDHDTTVLRQIEEVDHIEFITLRSASWLVRHGR